jgi:bifunctional non-homologous end joining protein LigD
MAKADSTAGGLVAPMLAVLSDRLPPEDGNWAYEMKWDGVRAVLYVAGKQLKAMSRNDIDMIGSYPELTGISALVPKDTVLDGEVVALDRSGRPSFEQLQARMHVGEARRAERLAETAPVTFMAFDLLRLDGRPTLTLPYTERRALLEGLDVDGPHWKTPPHWTEDGAAVLQSAREQQLEGVVAKQLDSAYHPGRRFNGWLKVKNLRTQEVVIGGWQAGEGRRAGSIGSLLLGLPEGKRLRYAGKVGTGFTDRSLRELTELLEPLQTKTSPYVEPVPRRDAAGAIWVKPTVVGEVRFSEWTRDGRLRHPAWRGLRPDKKVSQVVRDT